jgi:hypothetical protein
MIDMINKFKKTAFLVVAFLLSTVVYAQKTTPVSEEKTFLSWYYQNFLHSTKHISPILYLDSIYNWGIKNDVARDTLLDIYKNYKGNKSKDYLIISKSERLYINNQLNEMSGKIWTENLFKNSQMLDNYQKKNKTGFYSFSKPIFLRHNTYCIFSLYYYCGKLCAHGETSIYIKRNGAWSKWLLISEWES